MVLIYVAEYMQDFAGFTADGCHVDFAGVSISHMYRHNRFRCEGMRSKIMFKDRCGMLTASPMPLLAPMTSAEGCGCVMRLEMQACAKQPSMQI